MSEINRSRAVQLAALTRRTMLKGAAAAGLVAPLSGLVEPSRVRAAVARQEGNGTTLIVGLDGSPSDLDPHSQYDYRSTIVVRAIYEGLVGLKGSATDEFEDWSPRTGRRTTTRASGPSPSDPTSRFRMAQPATARR